MFLPGASYRLWSVQNFLLQHFQENSMEAFIEESCLTS